MIKHLAEKTQLTEDKEKQYASMYLFDTNTVIDILQRWKGRLWHSMIFATVILLSILYR